MSIKQKIGIVVLLLSPYMFVLMEFIMGVISLRLLLLLSLLYLVTIPLLVMSVIIKYKRNVGNDK